MRANQERSQPIGRQFKMPNRGESLHEQTTDPLRLIARNALEKRRKIDAGEMDPLEIMQRMGGLSFLTVKRKGSIQDLSFPAKGNLALELAGFRKQKSQGEEPQREEPLQSNPIEDTLLNNISRFGKKIRKPLAVAASIGSAVVVADHFFAPAEALSPSYPHGVSTPDGGVKVFGYGAPLNNTQVGELVNQLNEEIPTVRSTEDSNFYLNNNYDTYLTMTQAEYDAFSSHYPGTTLESYFNSTLAPAVRTILKNANPSIFPQSGPDSDPNTSTKGFKIAGIILVQSTASTPEYNSPNGLLAFHLQANGDLIVPGTGFNKQTDGSNNFQKNQSDDVQQILHAVFGLPKPDGQGISFTQIESTLSARMNPALWSYVPKNARIINHSSVPTTKIYAGDSVADASQNGLGTYNAKRLEKRGSHTHDENNVFESFLFSLEKPANLSFAFQDKDGTGVTVDPASIKFYRRTLLNGAGQALRDTPLTVSSTTLVPTSELVSPSALGSGSSKGYDMDSVVLIETNQGMAYISIQDLNMAMWLLSDGGAQTVPNNVQISIKLIKQSDSIAGNTLTDAQKTISFTTILSEPEPTSTNTAVPTAVFTATATRTPTPTPTGTETETPTVTKTVTITPTATITKTRTETPTSTVTATVTETSTATTTHTVTETATQTVTSTSTTTATPTSTETRTVTQTVTHTPTETSTSTVTNTVTQTVTETPTATITVTITETPTSTTTSTSTVTATGTWTRTTTATPTASPTTTLTWTPTPTPSQTPTLPPTSTPVPASNGGGGGGGGSAPVEQPPTNTPLPTFNPAVNSAFLTMIANGVPYVYAEQTARAMQTTTAIADAINTGVAGTQTAAASKTGTATPTITATRTKTPTPFSRFRYRINGLEGFNDSPFPNATTEQNQIKNQLLQNGGSMNYIGQLVNKRGYSFDNLSKMAAIKFDGEDIRKMAQNEYDIQLVIEALNRGAEINEIRKMFDDQENAAKGKAKAVIFGRQQ